MRSVMEKVLAGVLLAVCLVLALRMVLGTQRRRRLDDWFAALPERMRRLRHWRADREQARRVADEAIRRARGEEVERDGNVYRPKSFKKPPRDEMH